MSHFEFDISQSLVGTHEEVVIVHLFDTCNAAFQFIGHLMDLSGLCVVESDAVSAAEPNPVIAVHIAVADIDRCLGQFIYSVEHIVFLVVLKMRPALPMTHNFPFSSKYSQPRWMGKLDSLFSSINL